jgi:hypothetical protein
MVDTVGTRDQQHEKLLVQSHQRLLEFVDVELALGFTFVDFAHAERDLGNQEHFQHAKRDAEVAVQSIRHFLARVENEAARTARVRRCDELVQAIAAL